MRPLKSLPLFLLIFCLLFTRSLSAKEPPVPVKHWLQLGPVKIHLPAFHGVKNLNGKTFALSDLLRFPFSHVKQLQPISGQKFQWDANTILIWHKLTANDSGFTELASGSKKAIRLHYLVAYIHVQRYMEPRLEIKTPYPFQVFVDGQSILLDAKVSATDSCRAADLTFTKSQPFKLETGTHRILVKLINNGKKPSVCGLQAQIILPDYVKTHEFKIDLNPAETMRVTHLLDGPKVRSVALSPDGKQCIIAYQQSQPPGDTAQHWLELRRVKDSKLLQSYRGFSKVQNVLWAPTGKRFAFRSSDKDKSSLWIADLKTGSSIPLLENVENLGNFVWAPDGSFIIYSINENSQKNKTGLKRLMGMEDRWPWWRNRSFLYKVNVPSGTKIRLTAGKLSTQLNSISPDGNKLLFTRTIPDYSQRPYSKTQYFILNLSNLSVDSLWTLSWGGTAQWSPDNRFLLLTGGPSMFNGLGSNLPENIIPNDYDTQAYLYDLKNKKITAISKTFKPAINRAVWSGDGKRIYFITTDRDFIDLYEYDLTYHSFIKINCGGEVIHDFSKAAHRPVAVAIVSGASLPPRITVIDLKKRRYRLLLKPEQPTYAHVQFGKVERWTFVNKHGTTIEGRVYYPPDFSPKHRYPCIVYYYGGTTPVTRDFGGRYPKELWAANGYVVYVLQPSGATGFGQAFSALHVNDWGKIVSEEIIDGTKKFLAAHPFVDSTKVGCIGASYGGFMTMTLVSKTNLFAAAVAHAGISSISSYWGQGYWGYLYSAVATANSFPWNRKDIYVDRSPLFNANKINTPLLLLHGTADTNVPTGESIQLFTALKLLGKTVELIEIKGQNHHIMAYGKRKRWTKTIIAWFDRWLKKQPQWWQRLYPKK